MNETYDEATKLAERFHELYEELSPQFGYVTRIDTRTFDPATDNGRLMIEVCRRLKAEIEKGAEPVALCLRANKDGSYGEPVVFTHYAMYEKNLAKAKEHPWITNNAATLVPLYAAPPDDTQDAKRYRRIKADHEIPWIEDVPESTTGRFYVMYGGDPVGCLGGELDAAIDAAMEKP